MLHGQGSASPGTCRVHVSFAMTKGKEGVVVRVSLRVCLHEWEEKNATRQGSQDASLAAIALAAAEGARHQKYPWAWEDGG